MMSRLVKPMLLPYAACIHLSTARLPVESRPSSRPPQKRAPACVSRRYATVASPGRTPGTRAPTLRMYSATSLGVSSTSRKLAAKTSAKQAM